MTMKTYLALALLITVLAGNAYGEDEVYYSVTTKSVGLSKDKETGEYMPTNFTGTRKFTLKHKKNQLINGIEIDGNSLYEDSYVGMQPISRCSYVMNDYHLVVCRGRFHTLNFSEKTMKFVLTTAYGYPSDKYNQDPISITIGKCEKF
jgi:hypothetical protein